MGYWGDFNVTRWFWRNLMISLPQSMHAFNQWIENISCLTFLCTMAVKLGLVLAHNSFYLLGIGVLFTHFFHPILVAKKR